MATRITLSTVKKGKKKPTKMEARSERNKKVETGEKPIQTYELSGMKIGAAELFSPQITAKRISARRDI